MDLQVNLETESGAPVEPDVLIRGAKEAGLDGLVLTQEGAFCPDTGAYRDAGRPEGVSVFAGAKIPTNHGIILCIFPEEKPSLSDDWAEQEEGVYDAQSVIEAVEERGGVTVALRPYDREVAHPMGDHLFSLQGLSACEVQNTQVAEIANDLALEAASNMELPCVGTSCAAGADGLGTSATLLRTPVESESELCELIRNGDCWPLTFSTEAPPPSESRPSRGGRGRRGGRDGGASSGRGRRGGGGGGDRRGGGRRGRGERSGGNMDHDDGGRSRRRGRRRRRNGPTPDDVGNRAPRAPRSVDEDFGNRVPKNEANLPEDIGNRLAPGERSPYRVDGQDGEGNN